MLDEDLYIKFVIKGAGKDNKFFLLDSGEGNDYIDPGTGWYIEDLSGWLVNVNEKDKIIQSKENGTAYDDFSDSYVFVKWSKADDGQLEVYFKRY
jgi:hypothetical protein